MSQIVLKCRQCRKTLLDSAMSPILSGHSSVLDGRSITSPYLDNDCEDVINSLYIEETGFPEWILSIVDEVLVFIFKHQFGFVLSLVNLVKIVTITITGWMEEG